MSLVVSALERVARSHPSAIALEQAGSALCYDELMASVRALGERLRNDGLAAGDSVSVQASAVASLVQGALAVRAVGGVPCLAPGASSAFHARFLLTLVGSDATLRKLEAPAEALPEGTDWVRVTSGTTGSARAIAFTDEQALAGALRSAEMLGLGAGDTLVSTTPPVTAYGWTAGVLGPLLVGARAVHDHAWDLRGMLARVRDGVAWIITSPPVVRALARLEADGAPQTRARLLTALASYPDAEARICAERHGLDVIDRYGTAESGPVAQADEPGGPLRAAPGVCVRALGEGRLEIASDAVGIGYVAQGAPFAGRFATADCAQFLDDGRFRVVARADRIVRRAGRPVDLARVERLLVSLPGVARAHVEVRPGALDIQLVARLRPSGSGWGDMAALEAQVREALEPWERPSSIEQAREDEVTDKWEGAAC